jgi:hypothetical protein
MQASDDGDHGFRAHRSCWTVGLSRVDTGGGAGHGSGWRALACTIPSRCLSVVPRCKRVDRPIASEAEGLPTGPEAIGSSLPRQPRHWASVGKDLGLHTLAFAYAPKIAGRCGRGWAQIIVARSARQPSACLAPSDAARQPSAYRERTAFLRFAPSPTIATWSPGYLLLSAVGYGLAVS